MRAIESQFQEFYYEVLKCKHEAFKTIDAVIENNPIDSAIHTMILETFQSIQNTLKKNISNVSDKDVRYAITALADEIFITLPWHGAKLWENALLESYFFHSHVAGQQIYERIDNFMRNYTPQQEDMALLYFFIMTLGFKGQYQDYPEKIQRYINELHFLIQRQKTSTYLIPQCYDTVLEASAPQCLPDIRMWVNSITGVIIVYLFSTYVLWHSFVSELYVTLKQFK